MSGSDSQRRTHPAAKLRFSSRAVHAGEHGPTPDFTPTATPIYPATAFVYEDTETLDAVFSGERPGYVYSRFANPTTTALEAAIASLEGTEDAVAFASGMAAVYATMLLDARAGDRIVAAPDLYGASYAMLAGMLTSLGISTTFVDMSDLEQVARAVREVQPKLVYLESMSNPLLRIANLPAIASIAHEAGALIAVDNTFASPWLIRPAMFGVDAIVHSTTKYLGGHGDVTGGVVAASAALATRLREINKLVGAVPGPFESWLTLRGLKTLPLRMRQHSENGRAIAEWLAGDRRVSAVYYPGLSANGIADTVFARADRGGMVSFDIAGAGRNEVFRFMDALSMIVPATTLGDIGSLVLYPAISSHRTIAPELRATLGISDALVRLSVGIEDVEDIITDLDSGLAAATGSQR